MYKRSGLIEQIGEDLEYQFRNKTNTRVVTNEEQIEK